MLFAIKTKKYWDMKRWKMWCKCGVKAKWLLPLKRRNVWINKTKKTKINNNKKNSEFSPQERHQITTLPFFKTCVDFSRVFLSASPRKVIYEKNKQQRKRKTRNGVKTIAVFLNCNRHTAAGPTDSAYLRSEPVSVGRSRFFVTRFRIEGLSVVEKTRIATPYRVQVV